MHKYLAFFFLILLSGLLPAAQNNSNLLVRDSKPYLIWPKKKALLKVEKDALYIQAPHGSYCNANVILKPEWRCLRLDFEMKAENLTPGKNAWECGRMNMRFYGPDKKPVGNWPEMFGISGSTDWKKCSRIYEIPKGAVRLAIDPANYGKSGVVTFRDVTLRAFENRKDAEGFYTGLPLPPTDRLWSLSGAERTTVPGRERICLNSIWQVKLADNASAAVAPKPEEYDLFFKVPGIWPGFNGWKQPGSYQDFYEANGKPHRLDGKKINHVWYRRTIEIPDGWSGRDIELELTYIQTCGQVFIDGKKVGEFYFPGGNLPLTGILTPGKKHELSILVSARIDDAASVAFNAPDRLSKVRKQIVCRGITGDVYLKAEPKGPRILAAQMVTSVRKQEIQILAELKNQRPGKYRISVGIFDGSKLVRTVESGIISPVNGIIRTAASWKNPKLWDTDTPENRYTAVVTLKDPSGKILDTLYPFEFGFREFELRGRDFYLNGKKIHLRTSASQLPVAGAAFNTKEYYSRHAKAMKAFGMNHAVPLNYNFAPGETGYQDAFYVEHSNNGILTSMTLPHPANFEWKLDTPEGKKRYLELTGYLLRRYRNVPGLILYASTHNATGYSGDQNPARIDGVYSPDQAMEKSAKTSHHRRKQALIAAELTATLDPTRAVYHHESGNLGPMYTINCYLNWAPAQERSDWLEHWEKYGTKPLFMMEWGMPHVCSWSSFRGPAFIWGTEAPQCLWLNEYNAQYLGEDAYRFSWDKANIMNAQLKLGSGNRKVHFGKYNWFARFEDVQKVWAALIRPNFRDMRARGLSGLLPWDQDALFSHKKPKQELLADRFEHLKQTGISADYSKGLIDNFSEPITAGKAASESFQEILGWIAGPVHAFTAQNNYYLPGETIEKSLQILNDSRKEITVEWTWRVPELKQKQTGKIAVPPGERAGIPIRIPIPAGTPPGQLRILADFHISGGIRKTDAFAIQCGARSPIRLNAPLYVFDPEKTAIPLLRELGISFRSAEKAHLPADALLLIGRNALERTPGSLLSQAKKILILEQPYDALLNLGIRANEHGLRTVLPVHPAFENKPLANWRGSSSNVPHYLETPEYESQMPSWNWNGFANKRVWRSGNRGTVSGVIPEKPSIGDWMPLLQGGFDLQYAPMMEHRDGDVRILFSQLDLSGRTEPAPEAQVLLGTALEFLDRNTENVRRPTCYLGGERGATLLNDLKIRFKRVTSPAECPANALLILDPDAKSTGLADFVRKGGTIFGVGLTEAAIRAIIPDAAVRTEKDQYSNYANGLKQVPEFRGLSNADLHWRKPVTGTVFDRNSAGGTALGKFTAGRGRAVFAQIAPWMFDEKEFQFRTTRRRNFFLISRLAHNLGAESGSGFVQELRRGGQRIREGCLSLTSGWIGKADPGKIGRKEGWFKPDFKTDASGWRKVRVPGMFDLQFKDLASYDGYFWYRKTFRAGKLPKDAVLQLYLGPVDDESWVWLNGEFLGEISAATNPKDFWAAERIYKIPASKLKAEGNVLVVLCNDRQMNGGILGKPNLSWLPEYRLYPDAPVSEDDPYRYYRW